MEAYNLKFFIHIPRKIAALLISAYQKTLSPDHGIFKTAYPYGFCKFYPSCSEYSKQAVLKYGLLKGSLMGFLRILKCNPFSKPKADLISNI